MVEMNAMIEIRHDNDPRNRVMRTINARLFVLDAGEDMIRIDDVLTLIPGQEPELRKVVMGVSQLRDLLEQLGYSLMRNDDAQEIIEQYNEDTDADPPRCGKCGHEMKSCEGCCCAGYVCPECGHEDVDNTYY